MSGAYEWERHKAFVFGNTAGVHLRWRERPPGTVRGTWQLTSVEPPAGTRGWAQPDGLVLQGSLDVPPGVYADEHDIDLSAADPSRGPTGRTRAVTASRAAGPDDVVAARGARRYWLRVVGLGEDGKPVGNPSNAVTIDFAPPGEQPKIVPPVSPPPRKMCEQRLIRYEPARPGPSDQHRRVIALTNFGFYRKGKRYYLAPADDDDLLDDIGDAFESVGEAISDAWTWVAEAYADIKEAAVDVAAGALPGCASNPHCRAAISAGVDAGLAACGLPPELPRFEEFAGMAKGYLAAQLVKAAGAQNLPLAQDAAERAVDRLVAATHSAASGSGLALFRPDPAYQDRPPFIVVRARNPHSVPAPLGDFTVGWRPEEIYERLDVSSVEVPPGGAIDIPVVLREYHDWKFQSEETRRRFREVWEGEAELWMSGTRTRLRPRVAWSATQ